MQYRFGASTYDIVCRAAESPGTPSVTMDGIEMSDGTVALVDDGQRHAVVVNVTRETSAPTMEKAQCSSE